MLSSLKAADIEPVFYISTAGDDDWSGRLEEANNERTDGPLATLEGARKRVRAEISDGLDASIIVFIRGGEYVLDKTIVFDKEDSGSRNYTITYKAYPGETPVFTGGKKLEDWVACEKPPRGTSEKAKGKLWFCVVPELPDKVCKIKTLYNGTELLSRSRSPKFKTSDEQVLDRLNAQPKDVRGLDWDADPVTFSREFHFEGEDLKDWETPSDIEILLSPKHRWLINMLPLERIDYPGKTAWFAVDPTYGIPPGNSYQVENAIEYLDEPGEWIYNSDEQRIYIWPEFDLNSADIRAPFLQEFIRIEGVEDGEVAKNLHFEGLTFRHGLRDTWKPGDKGLQHDWDMYDKGNAVMRFRHAENASVKNCIFEASSGDGVRLDLH